MEGIGDKACQEVGQKVAEAPVPRMFCLGDVLDLVVYCFYDRSFAQQDLVPRAHRHVLHIVPDAGDQVEALVEEHFHEFFRDIPLVAVEAPEYLLQDIAPL